MKRLRSVTGRTILPTYIETLVSATAKTLNTFTFTFDRGFSVLQEDPDLKEFTRYLDNVKNYEKSGEPRGAGTDSEDGFDMGRMRRLMELRGNPQSKFKAVHVAGTKGKGSTASFLSNILRAEGYSVGCYTSPHIQTIRERISVGRLSEPVSAKSLNCLFQRIKTILDQAVELENGYISHFEVLTAVVLRLFADENIYVGVIEAGLGGARDATNIISSSGLAASVITTIGEEHLTALGGSLESIAMAKSGIIKSGRPVRLLLLRLPFGKVYKLLQRLCHELVLGGPFLLKIEHILRGKASLMGSPVVSASDPGNRSIIKGINNICGKPCQYCDIVLEIDRNIKLFIELLNVNLCMLGPHQLQNAATATCAALCLRHQAHTKESAKALAGTIQMTFPKIRTFSETIGCHVLSVRQLDAIILTEVGIAGDRSRSTPLSLLRDGWIQASKEVGVDIQDSGGVAKVTELLKSQSVCSTTQELQHKTVVLGESSLTDSLRKSDSQTERRRKSIRYHCSCGIFADCFMGVGLSSRINLFTLKPLVILTAALGEVWVRRKLYFFSSTLKQALHLYELICENTLFACQV